MTTEVRVLPITPSTGAVAVSTEPQPKKPQFLDDFRLAQKTANGDMEAFEEIYKIKHRRVFSMTLRMLGNVAAAEDMTQDIFIQVFRKISTYQGDSALSTWLHRVTVNQVLMSFRKKSNKNEKVTENGKVPEQIVTGTARPERMRIVDKIALEQAIGELPDGYKNVFVLHDVEGYEHEEIAEILGCSTGTTKSQLHKARLKLQKLLKKKINPTTAGLVA